jgi:hypothetical protein
MSPPATSGRTEYHEGDRHDASVHIRTLALLICDAGYPLLFRPESVVQVFDNAALAPLCAPRTSVVSATAPDAPADAEPATDGAAAGDRAPVDGRRPEQRRADAVVEVCKLALRTGELPVNGGEPPQLSVTVAFESLAEEVTARTPDYLTTLITSDAFGDDIALPRQNAPATTQQRRQFGIGTLDNGARLTPATVRRIACDARILPAVLGTTGQVLDVGRAKRLFEAGLRRAPVLRDGGCAFPACTRPARWCDGHHIQHWCDGGDTSLANAVLLCGQHHRLIHHSHWQVRLGNDGQPEFIPPVYLDLRQRPRRNVYHRRT